jgi:hypothetical protein
VWLGDGGMDVGWHGLRPQFEFAQKDGCVAVGFAVKTGFNQESGESVLATPRCPPMGIAAYPSRSNDDPAPRLSVVAANVC